MSGTEIIDVIGLIPPTLKDVGVLVLILSLVEISPVKLNPWGWLQSFAELPAKVAKLEHEFNDDRAFRWRSLIFNRARELEKSLKQGDLFRREWWDDTIATIGDYERYCEANPTFKNEVAIQTITYFKNQYQYALKCDLFL